MLLGAKFRMIAFRQADSTGESCPGIGWATVEQERRQSCTTVGEGRDGGRSSIPSRHRREIDGDRVYHEESSRGCLACSSKVRKARKRFWNGCTKRLGGPTYQQMPWERKVSVSTPLVSTASHAMSNQPATQISDLCHGVLLRSPEAKIRLV